MKIISLKKFIKTGKFDQIEVGVSTKQDVINLMGNDFDFGDCGESQIIKYGWYEFFYWTKNEIIFAIQNDHLKFDCSNHNEMIEYENENLKIDNWFLKVDQNLTFREIIQILNGENIDFKLEKYDFEDAIEYIKIHNGVTIDFDNELTTWTFDRIKEEWNVNNKYIKNQKDYVLNGIRLFKY